MGILSNVVDMVAQASAADATTSNLTMQSVLDATPDTSEAKRIRRLANFFNAQLDSLPCDLCWFDENFPSLKDLGAAPLPGHERDFWETAASYRKWREITRRRIRKTTGEFDRVKDLAARNDGWKSLLADLGKLSEDDGPVHPATVGAIGALANRARASDIEPGDLGPARVTTFLAALAPYERTNSETALKALARLKSFRAIAAHLPADFAPERMLPAHRAPLPEPVMAMINSAITTARFNESTHDDISDTSKAAFNENTVQNYTAALIKLARSAATAGGVDLDKLEGLEELYRCDVRIAVIKDWIEQSKAKKGFSSRSAASYVRTIIQIGNANGIDTTHWCTNLSNNDFLTDGVDRGEKMAPKNQKFCELLIDDPKNTRMFLTQHVGYQDIACDILATDKTLSDIQLQRACRFGTCAAFAAIELRGAGLRKASALSIHSTGPDQNLFYRRAGSTKWFEIRVAQKDMKGEYVELPPIPIRDNRWQGYQVMHWYLESIRPLFDFANPDWCEANGCAAAPWLFPAHNSCGPLDGKLLYRWLTQCSAEIGLRMTPHNFRHGIATLLLAKSWSNKGRAAHYLGVTERVLEAFYAWIDKRRSLEETQDLLAEALS